MKPTLKKISYNLLLSESLTATEIVPALANKIAEQKIAMQKLASSLINHFSYTKSLSAEKMLEIADKIYNPKMSKAEQELEFALDLLQHKRD